MTSTTMLSEVQVTLKLRFGKNAGRVAIVHSHIGRRHRQRRRQSLIGNLLLLLQSGVSKYYDRAAVYPRRENMFRGTLQQIHCPIVIREEIASACSAVSVLEATAATSIPNENSNKNDKNQAAVGWQSHPVPSACARDSPHGRRRCSMLLRTRMYAGREWLWR